MSARFECPQCQFVFVAEEAAFSSCPQCGSMAIPAGEPTLADHNPFSSSERKVSVSFDEDTALSGADIDNFDPFADMDLDESAPSAGFDPFAAVPDAEGDLERAETKIQEVPDALRTAAQPSAEDPAEAETHFSGEPAASEDEHPTIQIDPALTLDMGLEDNNPFESDSLPVPPRPPGSPNAIRIPTSNDGPTLDHNPVLKPEDLFSDAESTSGESPLSDLSAEGVPAPDFGEARPLLTDPFGDGGESTADEGEPAAGNAAFAITQGDAAPAPVLEATPSAEAEADINAAFAITQSPPVQPSFEEAPPGGGPPDPAFAMAMAQSGQATAQSAPTATEGFWDPNYTSDEIQPGAVLLHQLEAQMHGAQEIQSIGDLDDGSFDMLEQAFDEIAQTPDSDPMSAEDALRAASAQFAMSAADLPVNADQVAQNLAAPQAPSQPPPLRRRVDQPHLTLTEDTLAQCGLPIADSVPTSTTDGNLAMALTRGGGAAAPTAQPPPTAPMGATQAIVPEDQDPSLSVEVPAVPSTFAGFNALKVIAIVMVSLLLGAGLGAVLAPAPKEDTSARGMAESKFIRGNQAFEAGRYDDALGHYRGAIATDRTYVDAYRAKAATLAKYPDRQDEAAAAYRKYLEVAGGAADRAEVLAILSRFESASAP